MTTARHRKYIFPLLLAALALILVLASFLIQIKHSYAAETISETINNYTLDVNGKTTTNGTAAPQDTYAEYAVGQTLSHHNKYSRRQLYASYVYFEAADTSINAASAVFCDKDGNPLAANSSYALLDSAEYFSMTVDNYSTSITVSAKKYKLNEQSVILYVKNPNVSATVYKVVLNVTINAKLDELRAASGITQPALEAEFQPFDAGNQTEPAIIKINDRSTAILNLEDIAAAAVAKRGGLQFKNSNESGKPAYGASVKDFSAVNISNISAGTEAKDTIVRNETNNFLVANKYGNNTGVAIKANLSLALGGAYESVLARDGSSAEGDRRPLSLKITVSDGGTPLTLTFWAVIIPDTKPYVKTDSTRVEFDAAQKTVERRIKASDIVAFNRTDAKVSIEDNLSQSSLPIYLSSTIEYATEPNGENVLVFTPDFSKAGVEESYLLMVPVYYEWNSGADSDTITVPLTITVSGNFPSKQININGKRSAKIYADGSYTLPGDKKLNKHLFSEIINDDFVLMDAKAYNSQFTSELDKYVSEFIDVTFSDGVITITPKMSTGGTLAEAELTFINSDGVKRTYPIYFRVDIRAGSFFAKFEDWQAALIIAGICLGAILLIALIVFLVIVGVTKRKQEALATSAPTSAYIIKLNSTIAAAQAQTRMMTTQQMQPVLALNAPTQPQTLQLGYYNPPPQSGGGVEMPPPPPVHQEVNNYNYTPNPQSYGHSPGEQPVIVNNTFNFGQGPAVTSQPLDDIHIPISDEELVERIFVEKYEPKGMTRRSYFKNETLKKRELEKEKERIRDLIRSGVSPEEAVKSTVKRSTDPTPAGPAVSSKPMVAETVSTPDEDEEYTRFMMLYIKYIDSSKTSFEDFFANENLKNDILLKDFMGEPGINDDSNQIVLPDQNDKRSKEEIKFEQNTDRLKNLEKSSDEIDSRYERLLKEVEACRQDLENMKAELEKSTNKIPLLDEEIIGLNVKMSTAKSKEKDKIAKQINENENKIKMEKEKIAKLNQDIGTKKADVVKLEENSKKVKHEREMVTETINGLKKENSGLEKQVEQIKKRESEAREALARAEKRDAIRDLLTKTNKLNIEIQEINSTLESNSKQKENLKSEIALLQTKLLSTTDVKLISSLSNEVSALNSKMSQLEKDNSALSKKKSDKQIELTSSRRRANDQIEQKDVSLEDVIKAEDEILANLAYDKYIEEARAEQQQAELELFEANSMFEASNGNFAALAMRNAEAVSAAEAAAVDAEFEMQMAQAERDSIQKEFDDLVEAMLTATEDEQLDFQLKQFDIQSQLEEKQAAFDAANENLAKAREEIEKVKAAGIKANLESQLASEKNSEEAARKLEEAKSRYESASQRLERAVHMTNKFDLISTGSGLLSKDRKSIEDENLKKQLEQSKNEIEQARMQAELARKDAEKAAEIARLEAEQKAELARLEAERLIQENTQAAELARLEAERQAEEALRKAETALIEAERKAKEEASELTDAARAELEKARLEAQRAREEAERVAAEAKAEAERELARMRQELARSEEDEKNQERIRARKSELNLIRADVAGIKTEEDGRKLLDKLNRYESGLSDKDRVPEIVDLIDKIRVEVRHEQELALYKGLANRPAPEARERRTVKKVTERVNRIPRPRPEGAGAPGARPAGARPAGAPGARPAGARPAGAPGARPAGARPAGTPGARPASASGARPAGARPAGAPGARPAGARPAGAPGARPAGARPAGAPGARPAGTRPAGAPGTRPAGTRPPRE